MKKFRSGDIIYNAIKAYPKVRFFVNSGSIYYNNKTDTDGNAVIFDFLPTIPGYYVPPDEPDCIILTEGSDPITTQSDYYLQVESCGDLLNLLAEDGQVLLNEANEGLAPE